MSKSLKGEARVQKYNVLVGLNYPPDKRAEPGAVVDDLPGKSISWLCAQGYVELAEEGKK